MPNSGHTLTQSNGPTFVSYDIWRFPEKKTIIFLKLILHATFNSSLDGSKKNPPKSVIIINTTNDLQTYVADMYADF